MKIVYFSVIAFLIVSCSPFGLNPMGYEVQEMPLEEAWKLVSSMKYIPDTSEYCKSPMEFFSDGGGDCEDFAIALVYLLGPQSTLIIIPMHAVVYYKGQYIEPQLFGYIYDNVSAILLTIEYTEVMYRVTDWGTKKI